MAKLFLNDMFAINSIIQNLQDQIFDSVVSKRLVYNTCWEDPEIDRQLLNIGPDSKIVMLASAGCNAIDYLLDDPAVVHCVDANPSQIALLELKRGMFINADSSILWDFFGSGAHPDASYIYHQCLAPHLSRRSDRFWNQHINYFLPSPNEPSFYFRGTSGKVALMMHTRIKHKGLYKDVMKLLNSSSLSEQAFHFEAIEDELWSDFFNWLINQNMTMTLLGVPASQKKLIDTEFEGGLMEFIRSSLRHVFTRLSIQDNYFWRVYLTGSYAPDCCPNYLKAEYFDTIKQRVERIHPYTGYLTQFLRSHPDSYSHFALLDHQDWLAEKHPGALEEEWRLILQNSLPGTRILFRSAATDVRFLPDFVYRRVDFQCEAEKTAALHKKDRVGTYGSTHLGVVRSR